MKRYEWRNWTDGKSVKRRAGGRKRYNAQRRKLADARRKALAEVISRNPLMPLMVPGSVTMLARAFGVSPSTISRDLQYLIFGGSTYLFYIGGEFAHSVTRAYPGGPVISISWRILPYCLGGFN